MVEWRLIEGFGGNFLVSNTGLVKSTSRVINKSDGNIYTNKERLMSIRKLRGYHTVSLKDPVSKKMKTKFIHRLVAKAFIPNKYDKPQVNHINGNKYNNNSSNLEWVSASENIQHSYDTGLNTFIGEKHYNNSISLDDAIKTKALYRGTSLTYSEIAKKLGISRYIVHKICNNITWKHVKLEEYISD